MKPDCSRLRVSGRTLLPLLVLTGAVLAGGCSTSKEELLPAGEREKNVSCDLNDTAWFDRIDASGGAVFFASCDSP